MSSVLFSQISFSKLRGKLVTRVPRGELWDYSVLEACGLQGNMTDMNGCEAQGDLVCFS